METSGRFVERFQSLHFPFHISHSAFLSAVSLVYTHTPELRTQNNFDGHGMGRTSLLRQCRASPGSNERDRQQESCSWWRCGKMRDKRERQDGGDALEMFNEQCRILNYRDWSDA